MSLIYLDNNATTAPLPEVVDEVTRVSREAYGNPGSRHPAGRAARQVLETSRETIAHILDAAPEEVIFTSGGTEAINLALFGLCTGRAGSLVSPPGEHPATTESFKHIARPSIPIPIDAQGRLNVDAMEGIDWHKAALCTALLAHNETGVIQNLRPLSELCAQAGVPLHVDAVQAVGKIEVSFRDLRAAAMSLASHKFHGPRGIGALLLQAGALLPRRLQGGHQERDIRPGTEPVALAAGMALALSLWHQERQSRTAHLLQLRERLESGLLHSCTPIAINGEEAPRLPNTSSIAFPGCSAEALLIALDLERVCCSHGSACSSGSSEPAPILIAMGAAPEIQQGTLRFSLSFQNTESEIDEAVQRIAKVVSRIRKKDAAFSSPAD